MQLWWHFFDFPRIKFMGFFPSLSHSEKNISTKNPHRRWIRLKIHIKKFLRDISSDTPNTNKNRKKRRSQSFSAYNNKHQPRYVCLLSAVKKKEKTATTCRNSVINQMEQTKKKKKRWKKSNMKGANKIVYIKTINVYNSPTYAL